MKTKIRDMLYKMFCHNLYKLPEPLFTIGITVCYWMMGGDRDAE